MKTEMTILRNFADTDVGQLLQKTEYASMSQSDLRALIETWNKKEYDGNYFEMYAIEKTGVIVGQASLYGRSEHIVSCGIELYSEHRAMGHGTSAYRELLTAAKTKGFTIAVAQVRADNPASIALHNKMGFEAENYTYINKKGNEVYCFIKAL